MLGTLLPVEDNTTHEEINIWLGPMMALWKSWPVSGILSKVMFTLIAQITKYHWDFDISIHMKFIYKQVYNWVKGNFSNIENKLADVLPGMFER